MLLASQRERPGVLLNILRQTRQTPPRKMTHPQVSTVLKLRNSDLELKASVKKGGKRNVPGSSVVKNLSASAGDTGSFPMLPVTKLLSLHTQEPVRCNKSL